MYLALSLVLCRTGLLSARCVVSHYSINRALSSSLPGEALNKPLSSSIATMDAFGTAVTVIHEVYNITVFIRKVVKDASEYDTTVAAVQVKLDHEFLFLETFKHLFFDDEDRFKQFTTLPANVTRDVTNIILELSKCLTEYRAAALKHGINLSETEGESLTEDAASLSFSDSEKQSSTLQDTKEAPARRDRFKAFAAALKEKVKVSEWALFGKDKIEGLVEEYAQWTERLRQVMTLMLLVDGRVGSLTTQNLAVQNEGKALGLAKAAARQVRGRTKPGKEFSALDGDFTSKDEKDQIGSSLYKVGTYTDAFGVDSALVIKEKHTFDVFESGIPEDEKKVLRSTMVRDLAWMLKEDDEAQHSTDGDALSRKETELAGNPFNILPCVGYFDPQGDGYPSLIYRIPSVDTDPMTLHDFMLKSPRPSLGQRFEMAWSLASTIYNIHSSGWVHKNIWSRGILVFNRDQKPVPYLFGWGAARPHTKTLMLLSLDSNTYGRNRNVPSDEEEVDLEPKLYSHEERYGVKTSGYSIKHDIYSLGVILLELATWTPMSQRFAGPIDKARRRGELPPVNIVTESIRKLSWQNNIAQEMGHGYARVVHRCLNTGFNVQGDDDERRELISQFYTLVVEKLKRGVSL